jgi:hypothetical protein
MAEPPRAPGGQFTKPPDEGNAQSIPPNPPARETVWVACKLPHGLLLRTFHFETVWEPVMGGGTREVKIARVHGPEVRIRGNTFPYGTVPNWPIEGGFGFTANVDKAFWDEWVEQNKDHPAVKNRLIWAMPDINSMTDEAKKLASVKSGLEPLDPQNLPKGIEPADRRVNP